MNRILSAHSVTIVGMLAIMGGATWSVHKASESAAAAAASVAQQQTMTKRLISPGGRGSPMLSPGIMVGNTLYLSGQLGRSGAAEGVGGETKAAIESARRILQAAQLDLADVVSVTAFLVDAGDYSAFNTAYTSLFTAEPRPTRTTVFVKELVGGAKVELTMTAVKAQ